MATVTIDGRKIEAEAGKTILEVATENNIYIPTLCHHEEVAAYGACRLCVVQITSRGRERVVTACLYPVADGLAIKTDSPQVSIVRRTVIDLLLARCPDSEVIKDMAHRLGVTKSSFKPERGNRKCILCALCTRVCREVVGVSAISLANRGVDRQMTTPFTDFSEACIACGSCAYVCPTGAISIRDKGNKRTITMPHVTMEFALKRCPKCGAYWAPQRQLDYIIRKAGLPADAFDYCPDCRD